MARTARERIDADPLSTAIYRAILTVLDAWGEYAVQEKATSFHIVRGRAFLGIHPRREGLLVNIVLDQSIDSARMHRVEQVSASRWHHEVVLRSVSDVDPELVGWIAAAYEMTGPPRQSVRDETTA